MGPLHSSLRKGDFETVKFLLRFKGISPVVAQGFDRMKPLHLASAFGYFDIAQWLLENTK